MVPCLLRGAAGMIIDAAITWLTGVRGGGEGRSGIIWKDCQAHRLSSNQYDEAIHVDNTIFYLFAEGIFVIFWVHPHCWRIAKLNRIHSDKCGHVWNGDGWPVLWGLLSTISQALAKLYQHECQAFSIWDGCHNNRRILHPERGHISLWLLKIMS